MRLQVHEDDSDDYNDNGDHNHKTIVLMQCILLREILTGKLSMGHTIFIPVLPTYRISQTTVSGY